MASARPYNPWLLSLLLLPVMVLSAGGLLSLTSGASAASPASGPAPAPASDGRGAIAQPAQRSISVTGTAELKVAPDEFAVSVGVDSYAADAAAAKTANDTAMSALLDIVKENGVEPSDIRTENFNLHPRVDGAFETRRVLGYEASKTLVATLHDALKVEALLAALFVKGGANRIDGVTMTSTTIIEHRKAAREKALLAAREKAQAMASVVGLKVGRVLTINEDPGSGVVWGNSRMNVLGNASDNNTDTPVVGESMATGKIRVTATMNATFELID